MSIEFHIFASEGYWLFELEMPDNVCRITFLSIVDAARHARARMEQMEQP
jgi:hypothetical protein